MSERRRMSGAEELEQLAADMRAWCADVFADMPGDATDAEVVAAVAASYEGGIAGFVAHGGLR